MKKKHILVISQYFYPEQFRINDICEEWIKRDYEVTVVTGIPNYPKGKFYTGYGWSKKRQEKYNGINIKRIPIVPRGHNSIMLFLNYLSFVISGWFWMVFNDIKADDVFIYEVSPMTQALVGVWYAKRHNIPCYLYVTDLWPENVEIVTGITNPIVIKPIERMVEYIYRRCTKIFTSSKTFISEIQKRGIEPEKLEFWPQYAEEYYRPTSIKEPIMEIDEENRFKIIFAGNIGTAQGLWVLPKAAQILKQENVPVCFIIVGDGRYKQEFIERIKESNVMDMFHIINAQPPTSIPNYMAHCDTALICLGKSKVFSMTIPAKTQSCLACGMPIIVCADGEVQNIIKEAKCGVYCNAGDYQTLAKVIKDIAELPKNKLNEMSENALKFSNEHYNKAGLMDRMDLYL